MNNRLKPEVLVKYNITEHNQDRRYDVCYGEIADGSIVNISYMVNQGIINPNEVDYIKFLGDKDKRSFPLQYSFHTIKAISCIEVVACGKIKNINKYKDMIRG